MKKSAIYFWCFILAQALAIGVVLVMRVHYRKLPLAPLKLVYSDMHGGIKTVMDMFKADCGRYPTTAEGWKAMIEPPTNGSLPNWQGPYFDPPVPPKDPWGHDYGYRYLGSFNANGYDLYSCGPDGISKTGGNDLDDFNNWDPSSPHGGEYLDLFYGMSRIFDDATVLLIIPGLFIARWIPGIFPERMRVVIKENPLADWVWWVMSIVVVINFVTSFPPTIWR